MIDINLTIYKQDQREISTYSVKFVFGRKHYYPNYSLASTALVALTDQILESMDKGCVTGTVFLDLRKALDTVDHLLLINELKSLGVPGKSLEWFRSYLSGRVQQTMCFNALSPPAKITMGVPQAAFWDHCYSWCILMNSICSTQR